MSIHKKKWYDINNEQTLNINNHPVHVFQQINMHILRTKGHINSIELSQFPVFGTEHQVRT